GTSCQPNESMCTSGDGGAYCANFQSDNANCGACGATCPQGQVCSSGVCETSCQPNESMCTSGDGGASCANLLTDNQNCGSCATACSDGTMCSGGTCQTTCAAPLVVCNTDGGAGDYCADEQNDPLNCGGCGTSCSTHNNGAAVCILGSCAFVCDGSHLDCNHSLADGCEVDDLTDLDNCGACGNSCPTPTHGVRGCLSGTCGIASCAPGYADCDHSAANGCEVSLNDPQNCGGCGVVCGTGSHCSAEVCVPGVANNFNIISTASVTYQGYTYDVLEVSLLSNTSAGATWCADYEALCQNLGGQPVGCGPPYDPGVSGYSDCGTLFASNGVNGTLGCNPSSGVAAAASMAGYSDATGSNSFGFHYCGSGGSNCSNVWCSGTYCNSSLSYMDVTEPHGYTLCLMP
ncbi:MAG: hypothetical protein JST54_25400, partial [Deltaproteobacteria bacterium]|nr:hypothetical protein [Deltaproteobacteria bacterium]